MEFPGQSGTTSLFRYLIIGKSQGIRRNTPVIQHRQLPAILTFLTSLMANIRTDRTSVLKMLQYLTSFRETGLKEQVYKSACFISGVRIFLFLPGITAWIPMCQALVWYLH